MPRFLILVKGTIMSLIKHMHVLKESWGERRGRYVRTHTTERQSDMVDKFNKKYTVKEMKSIKMKWRHRKAWKITSDIKNYYRTTKATLWIFTQYSPSLENLFEPAIAAPSEIVFPCVDIH